MLITLLAFLGQLGGVVTIIVAAACIRRPHRCRTCGSKGYSYVRGRMYCCRCGWCHHPEARRISLAELLR